MKSMIFAAGLGTRLKPLTDTMPKALVPLCGKPLIQHVMDNLEAQGISRFVVNVHHFSGQVRQWLASHPEYDSVVSDESDSLLETGGGVRNAASLLDDAPFLIHNVDIISNIDISRLSLAPESISTIVASERVTSRYFLFDDSGRLVGWTNVKTGEVKSPYRNIDPQACRKLAFSGIHFMSPAAFGAMSAIDSNPEAFPLYDRNGEIIPESQVPLGKRFSIVDFYLRACAEFPIYCHIQPGLRIFDVGKPESLKSVADALAGL